MTENVLSAADCLEVIANIIECNPGFEDELNSETVYFLSMGQNSFLLYNPSQFSTYRSDSSLVHDASYCADQNGSIFNAIQQAPVELYSALHFDIEAGLTPHTASYLYQEAKYPLVRHPRPIQSEQNIWTAQETKRLDEALNIYGPNSWPDIAKYVNMCNNGLNQKTPNQCNQRWKRVQDPILRKGKWSAEEDDRLIRAVLSCPPKKWTLISAKMPGRTDIYVRYRLMKIGYMFVSNGTLSADYLP